MRPHLTAPWGLGARPLACVDVPTPRDRSRHVWNPLAPDWAETLSFQFAITNATTESHVLKQIYGPFRIDHFQVAQSATDGRNIHIYLAIADDNAESTVAAFYSARVPTTDAADTTIARGIGAVTAPTNLFPNQVVRSTLTRLIIVCDNVQAAPQSIWGSVTIMHMRPRTEHPPTPADD